MTTQLDSLRRYVAQRPRPPMPDGPREGRVVVIGSGKGGSGTSSVTALLGLGAARQGVRVLLVDGDAAFGSLHLLLGIAPGPGLGARRDGVTAPAALVQQVEDGLDLVPGPATADFGAEAPTAAERRALMRRVATLHDEYDLVLVDGGSRLDGVLAACAASPARLVAVTGGDRIAVAATYALIKVMGQRQAEVPVEVLINRAEPDAARDLFDEVNEASHHFLGNRVGYAGHLPDDDCLRRGVAAGMALPDAASDSPAAAAAAELAGSMIRQIQAGLTMSGSTSRGR